MAYNEEHDHHRPQDRDGGGIAEIEGVPVEGPLVDIGRDRFRRPQRPAAGHDPHQVEQHHLADERQHQKIDEGRAKHRDDDVDELGEPAAIVELGGAEHFVGKGVEGGQAHDHVEAEPLPEMGHQHRPERGVGVAQPGLLEGTKAEPPQYRVDQAPVIVVKPHPDDADHDIGHEHRREPDHPQGARQRGAGKKAERQQKPAQHIAERSDDGEGGGIAHRLPEHGILRENVEEVPETNELLDIAPLEEMDAVVERPQHRVEGEDGIDDERRGEKRRDRRPRGAPRPFGGDRRHARR